MIMSYNWKNGARPIGSKKPSLKVLAGKKIDELEEYAMHSSVARKLASMVYNSDIYNYFSKTLTKFKNYKLIEEIKRNPVPKHVAIIMDGNRRFAKSLGLNLNTGHMIGRGKVEEMLEEVSC